MHTCILKIKAELDQMKAGLGLLGVREAMSSRPEVFSPMFIAEKCGHLTVVILSHINYRSCLYLHKLSRGCSHIGFSEVGTTKQGGGYIHVLSVRVLTCFMTWSVQMYQICDL